MTTERDPGRKPPSEAAVAAYLATHPEFFQDNPAVLAALEIPHATGAVVSLVERQVAVLREENERLKARSEEMIACATENEALIRRIHQLVLALMESVGPQAIFQTLELRLAQDFEAERIVTIVFGEPAFVDSKDVPQFVGRESPVRHVFAAAIAARGALCGRLTEAQGRALLGRDASRGSAVVMPLVAKAWDGVLAVTSRDPERFGPTLGTEFLAYLGDVVTLILDPWVAKARPSEP